MSVLGALRGWGLFTAETARHGVSSEQASPRLLASTVCESIREDDGTVKSDEALGPVSVTQKMPRIRIRIRGLGTALTSMVMLMGVMVVVVFGVFASSAGAAGAAPGWGVESVAEPTNFSTADNARVWRILQCLRASVMLVR
jgi:hypothetical protein